MEWISIKDRLPKQYENVLVSDKKSTWVASLQKVKEKNIWWAANPDYKREYWDGNFPAMPYLTVCSTSHWMPLPEPPKE